MKHNFKLIRELAEKQFTKSKHPICDFTVCRAQDVDANELVICVDIAQQLEYNWRYNVKPNNKTNKR